MFLVEAAPRDDAAHGRPYQVEHGPVCDVLRELVEQPVVVDGGIVAIEAV